MCEVCTHNETLVINQGGYDPTRTTALRNAFARDMNRRFDQLARLIKKVVDTDDVFGLRTPMMIFNVTPGVSPVAGAFAFRKNLDKINGFKKWLRSQSDTIIFEQTAQIGTATQATWQNVYITDSYKRGVIRARYELDQAGIGPGGLNSLDHTFAINQPFHADRLGLLYSRAYSDLQGITAQMDSHISRILTQGMADGDNPRLLARKLVSTINGAGVGELGITDSIGRFIPAKRRAEILARTEIIRAHHHANVQEYRNWGAEGVQVQAEFATATDDRVCTQCASLHGQVFTLDEIQNMIPVHPQCRCIAKPKAKAVVLPGTTKGGTAATVSGDAPIPKAKQARVKKTKQTTPAQESSPTFPEELPVVRNTQFDKQFIAYINDDYGESYTLKTLSPREINNGFCDEWASFYTQKYGGREHTILDIVAEAGGGVQGHTFVIRNGKYIDAEHFLGVDNVSDLNYFRRASKFNKKVYTNEFLTEQMFAR